MTTPPTPPQGHDDYETQDEWIAAMMSGERARVERLEVELIATRAALAECHKREFRLWEAADKDDTDGWADAEESIIAAVLARKEPPATCKDCGGYILPPMRRVAAGRCESCNWKLVADEGDEAP